MFRLGSLFSGSGGFELAGTLCGIQPVWASEIEPFPIRVTKERFPNMKHYGDISKIDVNELETVDLITGGSPCQDMSIAGKRQGMSKKCPKCSYSIVGNAEIKECPECGTELEYTRSGLFMDQIRIVKEMRKKDELEQIRSGRTDQHVRPRFMLWENVVGAFSSNGGEDFRAVLEETARIVDKTVAIPRPENGKWKTAGCIMGNGYSIAWRVLDAQYWGVPQRRRRIALVADFGVECAGEILFKREGLRRNFTESRKAWQGITGNLAESIGGAGEDGNCLTPWDVQSRRIFSVNGSWPALYSGEGGGHGYAMILYDMTHANNVIREYKDGICPTLQHRMGTGGNQIPLTFQKKEAIVMNERQYALTVTEGVANTLTGTDYKGTQCVFEPVYAFEPGIARREGSENRFVEGCSPTLRASMGDNQIATAYSIQGNMIGRKDHNEPQGNGINEDVSFTLNTTDRYAVAYDCRNLALNESVSGTLQAKSNGGQSLNYINPIFVEKTATATDVGWMSSCEDVSPTLLSRIYKDPHIVSYEIEPEYIVRRLTPLECSRLQGFPDWWVDGLQYENPTEEDLIFWREVFETHRDIVTGASKPKTDKQIIKWLKEEPNDGAQYKLWGNGIALPCFLYVIEGIKEVLDRTSNK